MADNIIVATRRIMWNTYKRIAGRMTRLDEDDRSAIEFVMRFALLLILVTAICGLVITKIMARWPSLHHLM